MYFSFIVADNFITMVSCSAGLPTIKPTSVWETWLKIFLYLWRPRNYVDTIPHKLEQIHLTRQISKNIHFINIILISQSMSYPLYWVSVEILFIFLENICVYSISDCCNRVITITLLLQVHSSGSTGEGATENKWTTTGFCGPWWPGDIDVIQSLWWLDQDQVNGWWYLGEGLQCAFIWSTVRCYWDQCKAPLVFYQNTKQTHTSDLIINSII